MKVLLDHNIPKYLRSYLPGHLTFLARQLMADRLTNGELLQFAEQNGFEVLVTADQGIFYQQNNERRKIALVVISTPRWRWLEKHTGRIAAAVGSAMPGGFVFVEIPLPRKTRSSDQV